MNGRNSKRKAGGRTPGPVFSDRIRFNWGYHDARWERQRGTLRTTVTTGPQNLTQVSREYDAAYYQGYRHGAVSPEHETTSTPAWQRATTRRTHGVPITNPIGV